MTARRGAVIALVVASVLLMIAGWGVAHASPPVALGASAATPGTATAQPGASPCAGDAADCKGDSEMASLRSCLVGEWMHSQEEDTPEVRVYRPASYPFPRARGRDGFEFRENGDLVYLGIGRADGTEASDGRWTLDPPGTIHLDVRNARIEPMTLEVVSCDEETLKIRR